jgi:UDP-N-acetyl-alpha-D-muramoyl-L-alanyl-L-glutamate epimerase
MAVYDEFQFKSYEYVQENSTLCLRYAYSKGGPTFEERIAFPAPSRKLTGNDERALDQAFRLVFLMAGISYYKAYVPERLRCEAFALDSLTAAFLTRTYVKGLGEFAYQNGIDLRNRVTFVVDQKEPPRAVRVSLGHELLIPVGGGKDSIVTLECLRGLGPPVTLFAMGSQTGAAKPIAQTIQMAHLPSLVVQRTISPTIIALNGADALNGHVPITAILSAIAVACAVLHGLDTVVMSNESSANAPNLNIDGFAVNHQYSKSLEFEADFSDMVAETVTPDVSYFSFLRSLSEAEITRRFARMERYHSVFRSCNAGFRLNERARAKNWCCNCPKCRFVFLALAPFLDRNKLISIFGTNMLSDASQLQGFEELCGVYGHKPFECVGEIEESRLLMAHLSVSAAWKDAFIVRELGKHIVASEQDLAVRYAQLFDSRSPNRLPLEYLGALDACQ